MSFQTGTGITAVTSIPATTRVQTPAAASTGLTAARPDAATPARPQVDALTQQPLPPRFPWLSRLSHELEAASHQRSAFSAAPALGDHLDQSA